jgi:hypothetical protein
MPHLWKEKLLKTVITVVLFGGGRLMAGPEARGIDVSSGHEKGRVPQDTAGSDS